MPSTALLIGNDQLAEVVDVLGLAHDEVVVTRPVVSRSRDVVDLCAPALRVPTSVWIRCTLPWAANRAHLHSSAVILRTYSPEGDNMPVSFGLGPGNEALRRPGTMRSACLG